jgi:hypothetical protein
MTHVSNSRPRTDYRPYLVIAIALVYLCLPLKGHAAATIYLYNGKAWDHTNRPRPLQAHTRPVLFVHGHKLNPADPEPHYRHAWTAALNGLPSFAQALKHNTWFDIEPFYLNFGSHDRSLIEDARDIGDAVDRILTYYQGPASRLILPPRRPPERLAIIAYSKGTISTRLYLKSLQEPQYTLPEPTSRPFRQPVSEFIAIAPPNHGLTIKPWDAPTLELALLLGTFLHSHPGQQLSNGYRGDTCGAIVPSQPDTLNFMALLNGHEMANTHLDTFLNQGMRFTSYASEAPGNRANGAPIKAGILYVTLYDAQERDSVGGDLPIDDCTTNSGLQQGRRLALNLAPSAVNLPVDMIPGATLLNPPPLIEALTVHANTVHHPQVICLALYTVGHHYAPDRTFQCEQTTDGIPIIPHPSASAD